MLACARGNGSRFHSPSSCRGQLTAGWAPPVVVQTSRMGCNWWWCNWLVCITCRCASNASGQSASSGVGRTLCAAPVAVQVSVQGKLPLVGLCNAPGRYATGGVGRALSVQGLIEAGCAAPGVESWLRMRIEIAEHATTRCLLHADHVWSQGSRQLMGLARWCWKDLIVICQ